MPLSSSHLWDMYLLTFIYLVFFTITLIFYTHTTNPQKKQFKMSKKPILK